MKKNKNEINEIVQNAINNVVNKLLLEASKVTDLKTRRMSGEEMPRRPQWQKKEDFTEYTPPASTSPALNPYTNPEGAPQGDLRVPGKSEWATAAVRPV